MFQVSADEGIGKQSKLVEFCTQKLYQICASVTGNILTSQPCLHTLMQTILSTNQSVRTILVIL